MFTLVIATRNAHKAEEIQEILGAEWRCLTLKHFPDAPEVIEDAATFAGNAAKKAVELARWLSGQAHQDRDATGPRYVLADDSGLEVDALGGAPGVHSARFAAAEPARKGNTPDSDNNARLLRLLEHVPLDKRTARFRCVVAVTHIPAMVEHNASPTCFLDETEAGVRLFEGACEGHISFGPSGEGGFGYDPLFIPHGETRSFAELGAEEKNRISHRAKALQTLKRALQKRAV